MTDLQELAAALGSIAGVCFLGVVTILRASQVNDSQFPRGTDNDHHAC